MSVILVLEAMVRLARLGLMLLTITDLGRAVLKGDVHFLTLRKCE
jgi:hypothetical protein